MTPIHLLLGILTTLVLSTPLATAARVHVGDHHEEEVPEATETPESEAEDDKEWDVADAHGPHRDITFTVDQGTWMSVDVSPDGRTVVFDLLGDLWTVPLDGGDATRITHGRAWDYQPRWSPDGTEILFTSDRGGSDNIWILTVGEDEPRAVTEEGDKVTNSGAWSPDGELVAAKRRLTDASSLGTSELWLYHTAGGSGIQITQKDEIPEVGEPVFSPDDRFLYFSARNSRYRYNRNVHQGIYQIRRFDRITGEFATLTSRHGGAGNPALGPDGNVLAYVTREGLESRIILRDLVTGAELDLGGGLDDDQQEGFAWTGIYPAMDFTPDGRFLVYSGQGGIWKLPVNGGDPAPIPFSADVELTIQDALRFKPDVLGDTVRARTLRWVHQDARSGRILFSALGRLYIADADGTDLRRFLDDDDDTAFEYAPRFSPDGKSVAYVTWNDVDKGQVWRANANGGSRRQLTEIPGQYANPNWSPDGSSLVYLKGSGATLRGGDMTDELTHEIHIIDAKGGDPQFVISVDVRGAQARMPNPVFGPAGARIHYFENEDNKTIRYVSVRRDGTDKQTHAKIPYGEEAILSPDGKWLAYKHLHDGYVAPMPRAGRQVLDLGDSDGSVAVKKLSDGLADWLHWTDANTITWAAGPTVYRQTLDKLLAEPEKEAEAEDGEDESEEETPDPNAPEEIELVLEVPRHRPSGQVAIVGATILTMDGDRVVENGVVLVEGNRITAVGPRSQVEIPADVDHTVDATGMVVVPGFIDAHAHMGYGGLDIHPQRDWRYYANLAYGVTTTMDPSASTHLVFAQSEMVEAGIMVGPRIYSTGFILYGADIPGKAPVSSLDDARQHVRRLKTLGAFAVKSYMQPQRKQRQWLVEAAREEEMLNFPEGGGNFEYNLGMILDGHTGIEHSVPVTPLHDDVIEFWKRTEVGYTPTLLVSYGGLSGEHWFYQNEPPIFEDDKLQSFVPHRFIQSRARRLNIHAYPGDWHHMDVAASAKRLVDAGVKVNVGGHGQLQGLGAHWEMWALSQGGMDPMDVLRCATTFGAHYIGLDDELGTVETGKVADLVVLAADPRDDIRNTNSVRWVVKNGELFDADTMDRLHPEATPRAPFVWQTPLSGSVE